MTAIVRRLGEFMRNGRPGLEPHLECVLTLTGDCMVAVVYAPNRWGVSAIALNRLLLTGRSTERVLLWARRELASGARVAWLLADELDALA